MDTDIHIKVKKAERPPLRKAFIRAQIVSLCATSIDFTVSLFLNHFLAIYYVTATSLGSVFGAITSFTLGRNWAFLNRHGHIRKQVFKFITINIFSIFANTTGVFFFKETFDISFFASRLIVAVLIGVCFNFSMNRYFVFR
jgi:putative flippase GtrA